MIIYYLSQEMGAKTECVENRGELTVIYGEELVNEPIICELRCQGCDEVHRAVNEDQLVNLGSHL